MGRKGQEHVFALLEAAGRLNLVVLVTFFFFFLSPCLFSSELTQQVVVCLTQLCRSAEMCVKELSPT